MRCPQCDTMTRVVNSRVPNNKSRDLSKEIDTAVSLMGSDCPLRIRERVCPQCGYYAATLETPLTSIVRALAKKEEP